MSIHDQLNEFRKECRDGFSRLEGKLDNHLERLSKAEEAIEWMKGHIKISTSLILSLMAAAAAAYWGS